MHIKRYEAPTLEEALACVKRELGPDALILSSRTIQRGRQAFGLLSRSVVEVQAAVERGAAGGQASRRSRDLDPDDEMLPTHAPTADAVNPAELRRERARILGRERFEEEVRSELRGLRQAMNGLVASSSTPRGAELDPVVVALTRTT